MTDTIERQDVIVRRTIESSEERMARKGRNRNIRRALYGVTAAGLAAVTFGVAKKHYVGVERVQNDDGSTSLDVKFPAVPPTTMPPTTLPRMDVTDRTELAVTFQNALLKEPWCDTTSLLADPQNGNQYKVCADGDSLKMSDDKPYIASVVLELVLAQGEEADSVPNIYATFANNTAACTASLAGITDEYRQSVATFANVLPASVPKLDIVIDAHAAEIDPNIACGHLCMPISADCSGNTVPVTTVGD